MEGIFTLPYSEFETIHQVQKLLGKHKHYSICIPTSRQQKGFDFIILNSKKSTFLKVQVKSSRAWTNTDTQKKKETQKEKFKYSFWFNNFINRYEKGIADLYLLFGLYPVYTTKHKIKSKDKFWKSIILCFSDKEMYKFLKQVKTKKEKKRDGWFGVAFNTADEIFGDRGLVKKPNLTSHLLNKKKLLKLFNKTRG